MRNLLWLVAAGANGLLTAPDKRDAVGKAAERQVAAETTRPAFEQRFATATRRRPGCVDDTSTSDVRGYGCDPWYDCPGHCRGGPAPQTWATRPRGREAEHRYDVLLFQGRTLPAGL